MLKGIIATILFIISFNLTYCQAGTYCSNDFSSEMCYTLNDGNSFDYLHRMCVAIEEGKGTYHIKEGMITFLFEEIPFFKERYLINKIGNADDSIHLNILVFDYDTKEPIENFVLKHQTEKELNSIVDRNAFSNAYKELKEDNYSALFDNSQANFYIYFGRKYSDANFWIKNPGIYNITVNLKRDRLTEEYVMMEGAQTFQMEQKNDTLVFKSLEFDYEIPFIKSPN